MKITVKQFSNVTLKKFSNVNLIALSEWLRSGLLTLQLKYDTSMGGQWTGVKLTFEL